MQRIGDRADRRSVVGAGMAGRQDDQAFCAFFTATRIGVLLEIAPSAR